MHMTSERSEADGLVHKKVQDTECFQILCSTGNVLLLAKIKYRTAMVGNYRSSTKNWSARDMAPVPTAPKNARTRPGSPEREV